MFGSALNHLTVPRLYLFLNIFVLLNANTFVTTGCMTCGSFATVAKYVGFELQMPQIEQGSPSHRPPTSGISPSPTYSPSTKTPPLIAISGGWRFISWHTSMKSAGSGATIVKRKRLRGPVRRYLQKEIDEECKKSRLSGTPKDAKICCAGVTLPYKVSPRIGTFRVRAMCTRSWCFNPVCGYRRTSDRGALSENARTSHVVSAGLLPGPSSTPSSTRPLSELSEREINPFLAENSLLPPRTRAR